MSPAAREAIDNFTRFGAVYRFLRRTPPPLTDYLGDRYWAGFLHPEAPIPPDCTAGSQAAQAWLAGQDNARIEAQHPTPACEFLEAQMVGAR
jgi:hypothetical protein